ncbi:hypothetical protein PGT21_021041 [Puccinia graminis f. sp. tritici]|uniref:Secreted protein n=1 Tax=Puccinia graminis f. sp. tritici TaxID=56615 RepID=A0A5B0PJZ6_PUCGR|nr:hypothetical protein PGT21_021041 [Puccinia graminis f. sp. tritici]KAA1100838.1 hypothetical protein PGTUg99_030315 [Puccinia graminis f. sp. tritici]
MKCFKLLCFLPAPLLVWSQVVNLPPNTLPPELAGCQHLYVLYENQRLPCLFPYTCTCGTHVDCRVLRPGQFEQCVTCGDIRNPRFNGPCRYRLHTNLPCTHQLQTKRKR